MITYHYRGMVERTVRDGRSRRVVWREGYSADGPNGGALYPWMTKRECLRDAEAQGEKARFSRSENHPPERLP